MDELVAELLSAAGDKLYGDRRVRWVLEREGLVVVVLNDSRAFYLEMRPIPDWPDASRDQERWWEQ